MVKLGEQKKSLTACAIEDLRRAAQLVQSAAATLAQPTDSPTDTRNIGSAGLLRIVLQRTIQGESLDEDCRKVIELLHKVTQDNPKPTTGPCLPDEGYYRSPDDNAFVKVQISQTTNKPYAKRWNTETETWEYVAGLYYKLRGATPLSAEDAKEWGDLYHHCIFCGLKLTDPRSETAGYGPTCAENRGLPWG